MNSLLRALILGLMMLALPLQSYAMATMLVCAPDPTLSHGAAHVAAQATLDDDSTPPCHARNAALPPADDAPPAPHSGIKCVNCAVCAIGAVLAPAPALSHPVLAPPAGAAGDNDGYLPSVHLALPERPPRPLLA